MVATRIGLTTALLCCLSCVGADSSSEERTIRVEPFLSLRGVGDSIDLLDGTPAVSSRGVVAVKIADPPSAGVALYDASGRFLRRVTRPGGGPGEVRQVMTFGFGPGDTLWVLDLYLRLHGYSPSDWGIARTITLSRPIDASVTSEGILVPGLRRGLAYEPPELLGWDGQLKVRFGKAETVEPEEARLGAIHLVDSSRVWVASTEAYAIDELLAGGVRGRRVARNVAWFPAGQRVEGMPWESPPRSHVAAVSTDSLDRLWVLVRRARADWAPQPLFRERGERPLPASQVPTRGFLSRFYETVIDVFDAGTGQLIASEVVSGEIVGFASSGVVFAVEEDESGMVSLRLSRVSLQ